MGHFFPGVIEITEQLLKILKIKEDKKYVEVYTHTHFSKSTYLKLESQDRNQFFVVIG